MSLHVQDAGDGVTLSEGGQRAHQLASVIQVAAVRTVQPHVGGGVVVVISHRPARHTNACALIAPVLFGDVELKRRGQTSDGRRRWSVFVRGEILTFQMKQPDVMAVVARP